MLLTITQNGRGSATGSFPQTGAVQQSVTVPPVVTTPQIPPADATTGRYGGLLYICDASLNVGDIVMAYSSTFDDGIPRRYVTRMTGMDAGPVLGIVASKARLTVAEVLHEGTAPIFEGLVPGQRYYLAADGTLIACPLAQDPMAYVHYVGFAAAEDTLSVQPSFPLLKRTL